MVRPYAVIENGAVVNIAAAYEDFAAEQGWVLLPTGVGIGWLYDGQAFSIPPDITHTKEQLSDLRAQSYRVEADPIFFKAQRGEATMDEWLAKVAEIKALYPYPAE